MRQTKKKRAGEENPELGRTQFLRRAASFVRTREEPRLQVGTVNKPASMEAGSRGSKTQLHASQKGKPPLRSLGNGDVGPAEGEKQWRIVILEKPRTQHRSEDERQADGEQEIKGGVGLLASIPSCWVLQQKRKEIL